MISYLAQIEWNNIPIFFGIYVRKAGKWLVKMPEPFASKKNYLSKIAD